jgi:hypothetical protein
MAQDPWRLGGWVLLGKDGDVVRCHPADDAADILVPDEAQKLLESLG